VRQPRVLVVVALAVAIVASAADGVRRTFDQDALGAVPQGFHFASARVTSPGRWLVRGEGTNRYLAHLGEASAGEGFAMALVDTAAPGRLRLSARMKLADGGRVGGLVWRYRGADDFYAVALDLDTQEAALYRVTGGNRVRLEREDDLELDRDAWHVLRVEAADGRIRVALGGIGIMRARMREPVGGADRAGVWAAGNTTAWFDDIQTQEAEARDQ